MSSSTKEYAVSEHSGFFVQPLIARSETESTERNKRYIYATKISDGGKRNFTLKGGANFDNHTNAANAAYIKGRDLVDEHNASYRKSLLYRLLWKLGSAGVFKD